uniref:Uncharacterized protein n=1 Tax=Arundo donax TaxID=35708 RepID=A0A0A9C2U3_ARUDO
MAPVAWPRRRTGPHTLLRDLN